MLGVRVLWRICSQWLIVPSNLATWPGRRDCGDLTTVDMHRLQMNSPDHFVGLSDSWIVARSGLVFPVLRDLFAFGAHWPPC